MYNFDKNATFMNSLLNPLYAKENEQRMLSYARSGDGSLQFESDDVQELTTQAGCFSFPFSKELFSQVPIKKVILRTSAISHRRSHSIL